MRGSLLPLRAAPGTLSKMVLLRRTARTVGTGVLAALVLGATALGGFEYVYCVPMAQAQTTCCCAGSPDEPATPGVREASCCEGRHLASLPTSSPSHGGTDVAPPVAAPVLALTPTTPARPLAAPMPDAQERAGPAPPRIALSRRFRL